MPTHYKGTPEEERALNTVIKLARAWESVETLARETMQAAHLTEAQFGVLEVLLHLGPLTMGEIARKHLKSPNNFSVVVDNLERDGLVRRERDTCDRRTVYVHLTDAGRACIASLFPTHAQKVTEIMSVLTAGEQETLGELLRRLGRQEKGEALS